MDKYTEALEVLLDDIANFMSIAFEMGKADFAENQDGFKDFRKVTAKGIEMGIERYDKRLFKARPDALTPIKTSSRTLLSMQGDIHYTRHVYRTEAGETLALVDEALGIQKSQKMVPSFQAALSELALEQSFEKTARLLEAYGASYVSKETVKTALEKTECLISEQDNEAIYNLFELGEIPKGLHNAEDVYVEVDSTFVPSQEEGEKKICIKGASIYAGKVRQHNKTVRIEPSFVYTQEDMATFKKRVVTEVFQQFEREKIKRIHIGFDGETQFKTGWQDLFGKDICVYGYIDPYHLNKYIEKAFSKNRIMTEVYKNWLFYMLKFGFVKNAIALLDTLSLHNPEKLIHFVNLDALKDLRTYIKNNEDYIQARSARASLGTIESDHMRIAKARMCARPCAWSQKGAHALVRVNAHKLSHKLIPICKKEPTHVRIKHKGKILGDSSTIRVELKENRVQSKNKTEYIYAYQGSIVGAPASVRFAAKQYGNRVKGTY